MNLSAWAVGVAFLAGSLRAVQLWRAGARVEVVNSVVLTVLGEGRTAELTPLLKKGGGALYPEVARHISEPVHELRLGTDEELREHLERKSRGALLQAVRRLQRFAWLDHVALLGILFTGVSALMGQTPDVVLALELMAATLLWLSNLYGARNTARGLVAGATALVDALVDARRFLPTEEAHAGAPGESPPG